MDSQTSTPTTPIRKQTYYHQDEGFDYEKFFQSIYSFLAPIIETEHLLFTSTFIFQDKVNRPYASYRISKEHKKITAFEDEVEYLEKYKIFLDDKINKGLTVSQIYDVFPDLDPDEEGPIDPVVLIDYFQEVGLETPDPDKIDFKNKKQTTENFKLAEKIYLKVALTNKGMGSISTVENLKIPTYWPLPIISQGNLVGIIYIIIHDTSVRGKGDKNPSSLRQYLRLLLLQATREYEKVRLESKLKKFHLKPQEPLKDYLEVFWDLTKTNDPQKKKEINYIPIYGYKPENYQPVITKNPFLSELGYDDYYEHLAPVIIKESLQLREGKLDKIKTAITAIIVDSFAHNIGAHSLVALKWWFENRYKIAARQFEEKEVLNVRFNPKSIKEKIQRNLEDTIRFHSFMDDLEHRVHTDKISLLNIIRFMDDEAKKKMLTFTKDDEVVAQFPIPVAQSIFQFFQYLRDKSAFWSGVARDTVFSGLIISWKDLIRSFLNNTLFLGTIAHSEGINKVHFHIEIIGHDGNILVGGEYARINLEVIEREKAKALGLKIPKAKEDPLEYSEYAFLRKGKDFRSIHDELEKLDDVFLPNGVIGQHALYTIIENTLRNVKHYKSQLEKMRRKGAQLYISIESTKFPLRHEDNEPYTFSEERSLFKIGAWLHHPQELRIRENAKINEEEEPFSTIGGSVIESVTQQLRKRVVDADGNPILGGSSQDKVCAAMLMNNRFLSIDEVDLEEVKRHFFPYVYAASEFYAKPKDRVRGFRPIDTFLHKIHNPAIMGPDSATRTENYKNVVKRYIKKINDRESASLEHRGIIKKFFHLWKGRKCKIIDKGFDRKSENISRFKIVAVDRFFKKEKGEEVELPFRHMGHLADRKHTAEYELRNRGVIRLMQANAELKNLANHEKQYEWAMKQWLGHWFAEEIMDDRLDLALCKPAGNKFSPVSLVSLYKKENEWEFSFLNEREMRRDTPSKKRLKAFRNKAKISIAPLNIAHGKGHQNDETCCKVRSHCAFFNEIFEDSDIEKFNKSVFKNLTGPLKLFETVLTHITIFDERMHERLPMQDDILKQEKRYEVFRNQLRIDVYPESWKSFQDNIHTMLNKNGHFIVLHLSFLESIHKTGTRIPYKEHEVKEFFLNEIVAVYEREFPGKEFPLNIIMVIVSGRGRGDWFKATEHPQITFRPVEAMLDAVEDGLSLKDDFQVKFNLCNVLFGS